MPNCKITLKGDALSDKCQRAIEIIMQALARNSPSDSFLNLRITYGEGDINAFLSITSSSVKFYSKQNGEDPLLVVKQLSKDLQTQIKIWMAKRVF